LLENPLTDGDEVVSLTCRPPFTAKEIPKRLRAIVYQNDCGNNGVIVTLTITTTILRVIMVEEHCPLGCFQGGIDCKCLLGVCTVQL
jgi:hypothetical protein